MGRLAKGETKASGGDRSPNVSGHVPLLKWPGGKRWAADVIAEIARPLLKGTYFEPFFGGGAVFFRLAPVDAVLSDINGELVATYRTIRSDPGGVRRALTDLRVSKRDFYRIRRATPATAIDRAARFLYLNRTAFGGVYRLNQAGKFNVPYAGSGRNTNLLLDGQRLRATAAALRGAAIKHTDFEPILESAGKGDVVYCDPAYTTAHNRNAFVRYNEKNFSWSDQGRLARAAARARDRGASVIISNAFHPSVRELYPGVAVRLERHSRMSVDISKRGVVAEYLFVITAQRFAPTSRVVRLSS